MEAAAQSFKTARQTLDFSMAAVPSRLAKKLRGNGVKSAQSSKICLNPCNQQYDSAPTTITVTIIMLKKIALGFALGAATTGAVAQTAPDIKANPANSAYLQDSRSVIARSGFGLCWRSGYWSSADAVPGCDGELAPPIITSPIAPPLVQQATAPTPTPTTPKRCDFTITLANDETFAFNKATLNSDARKRIDKEVLPKLDKCAKIETVLITGHTDRFGSQQYNQKLSEKRAEAVAAYLKSKGVNAQINTLGAGKTQPVKSCSDKLPRPKLIECLAINRRVVIEGRGLAE